MLQSPMTTAFADLWYETRDRTGVAVPSKADFPLRRLAPFMPSMSLVGFDEDPDGTYLLFGTTLVSQIGIDLTGWALNDTMDDDARAQRNAGIRAFHEEFGADAARARWTLCKGCTGTGRIVEFEDLSLPYIEPSTGTLRHMCYVELLGGLDYGEDLAHRFPAHEARWFDGAKERPAWLRLDPASLLVRAVS
ncbi:MAG: hypothetical protein RLO08_09370 [Parvibaculaceae bacterium]